MTSITIIGNLTADPELRFAPSGVPVASFTVAVNHRRYDKSTQQWVDDGSDFHNVTCWKGLAENAAASLAKGMRVIVQGQLKSRSFETKQGEKRTVWEVRADGIGPDLAYATAQVQRNDTTPKTGSWGQQTQAPAGDPWGQQQPVSEPPF